MDNSLEIFNEDLCCGKCDRELPNKKCFTENGCMWCDADIYLKGDNQ